MAFADVIRAKELDRLRLPASKRALAWVHEKRPPGFPGGRLLLRRVGSAEPARASGYDLAHRLFMIGPKNSAYPTSTGMCPYCANLPNELPFVIWPNSRLQDLVSVQYG